jgi:uncharacterized protein YndB with AHSA1/START domain
MITISSLTTVLAAALSLLQSAPADPVTVTRTVSPDKSLTFEVTVPAAVADVWTALTTREGVTTWLWRDARIDLRAGGDWLVLYPEGKSGGGTVVSYVPNRRLVLTAMAPEQFPTVRAQRTTATFDLEPLSASSTKVTLRQTGWKEGPEWDAAFDYLAQGNAILLKQLYRRFVSGPIDWSKVQ